MKPTASRTEGGFSLVEVLVAVALLAIGALALMSVTGYSLSLDEMNRETAVATEAARQKLEALRGLSFENIYAECNEDPADDPDGVGSGAGPMITISKDEHGVEMFGELTFPVDADGKLREDLTIPELGMPRDLNGDGTIDAEDHSEDYIVLPVLIRLRWSGSKGARDIQLGGVLLP